MVLEKELETYRKNLTTLRHLEGRFVLVYGDDVVDTYDTFDMALEAGCAQFGSEPFLVKQIRSVEPAQFTSRLSDPYGRSVRG